MRKPGPLQINSILSEANCTSNITHLRDTASHFQLQSANAHTESYTENYGFFPVQIAFACKRDALQYTVLVNIHKRAKFQEEGGDRRSSYPKKLWTVYNKKILRFGPFPSWNKKKERSPYFFSAAAQSTFTQSADTTIMVAYVASHLTWSFTSMCGR